MFWLQVPLANHMESFGVMCMSAKQWCSAQTGEKAKVVLENLQSLLLLVLLFPPFHWSWY